MTVSDLALNRFVSLVTFRRSGVAVATPVWVAPDGDALVVTTGAASGKVRRLRNDAHVTLQPCDRRGRVREGAPSVDGTAEIVTDDRRCEGLTRAIGRKYRWEFRVVMAVEKLVSRGGRERVVLRITDR